MAPSPNAPNTLPPGASIEDISMVDHNSGRDPETLQDSQNPKPTDAAASSPENAEQSRKSEARFLYSSYRAFLDTNVESWPELRWMQVFLEHQGSNPSDTQVDVIDSKDGSLHSSQVPYTGAQNLLKALEHRSFDVNTRIIIVSYRESLSIDRGIVEVLGRLFSIDPLAFLQHFHHERLQQEDSYNDKYKSRLAYEPHAFLPSEQPSQGRCLHFGLESRKYASAMFFGDGFGNNNISKATVVIWIRSPRRYYARSFGMHPSFSEPPRQRIVKVHYITGTYVDCLLTLDPGVVRMADRDLRQYIAPLIRVFLKEHYVEFRKEIDPFWLFRPTLIHIAPEDLLPRIRHRLRFLDNMRLTIRNLLKDGENSEVRPAQAPIHKTVGDLYVLIDELKEAEGFYERLQREQLLNAQLQEARKSTETAVSVARLTKLAFIFIPLSFVTSFFGMNVKQFGNGNINIWVFFATAVAMICLTLSAFMIRTESGEIAVCTVKLFMISPYVGFWFLAFTLFNTHKVNMMLCERGVFHYFSKGKQGCREYALSGARGWRYTFGWREESLYRQFWSWRAQYIMGFFYKWLDSPDWKKLNWTDRLLWQFEWWRLDYERQGWTNIG